MLRISHTECASNGLCHENTMLECLVTWCIALGVFYTRDFLKSHDCNPILGLIFSIAEYNQLINHDQHCATATAKGAK